MNYFFISIIILTTNIFALSSKQNKELFLTKIYFEQKAYQLKILEEQEQLRIMGKVFDIKKNNLIQTDNSCVEWVYQGPYSREQAASFCRGVRNMECVRFMFEGPYDRQQSAEACRGHIDMECVRFVFQGPSNRLQSVNSCNYGGGNQPPRDC